MPDAPAPAPVTPPSDGGFSLRPRHVLAFILFLIAIGLFSWHWPQPPVASKECTAGDLAAAHEFLATFERDEQTVGHSAVWPELFHLIEAYRQCDEAPVSAEFSSATCVFLAHRWSELPDASRESRKSTFLAPFLEAHVDETCDDDLLEAISAQAQKKCPRYARELCARLQKRAEAALAASNAEE